MYVVGLLYQHNVFFYSFYFQADDVNRTLDTGRKALHYAADAGQTDVVEFLIAKGADVNVRSTTTTTHNSICVQCKPPG